MLRRDTTHNNTNIAKLSGNSLQQNINILSHDFIIKFKKLSHYYANFHIIFISIGICLILATLLFFSFFSKSFWSGFLIGFVFFIGFLYFVLYFYFQAKKPQQFIDIKKEFHDSCEKVITDTKGSLNYFLKTSFCLSNLAGQLNELEGSFYPIPERFQTLAPLLKKFSIWMHWKDLLKMKELLLLSSINETVALVKTLPTDTEAHANLANGYIALSKIYISPVLLNEKSNLNWISPEYQSKEILAKFHLACDRAIEELKILNEYSPQDPWVHKQLAEIYHSKGCPELEIKEYEHLLKVENFDKKILFRLGVLYFEQGHNSKGLKVYEQIKLEDEGLAEELIKHYDSFQFHEISIESLSSSV
ncbi:MAG: hypothetical protein FJZ57_03080 [Chlamydiae bacterium]|nr:hypothetical protein [Chlamydiota bacterium]